MQELNNLLSLIDAHFGGSQWFVFLLLGTGLFFTVYLRFPQLRFFGHAIKVVRGKYDNKQDIGDTSHFQALATALSGTVGTGNIAGVALAIHLGGPSALFWMLMTAFLGMTTKMVEVTLSHKYREQTEDGTIYLGSIDGFIAFNPKTFSENRSLPSIVITDFLLFGKEVYVGEPGSPLEKSITFSDELILQSSQNSFSFRVTALDFQAPRMSKIMYKLDGFDADWLTIGESPIVTYSNLRYGNYTFKVKVSNSDGVWNENGISLKVHILPPFYLSVWAYFVYALLIIGCSLYVIIYFKRRSNNKHRRQMEKFEQEKEREVYHAKIDFFTNVAHEIRTPLNAIVGFSQLLAETDDPEERHEFVEIIDSNNRMLLQLISDILDLAKIESGTMDLKFADMNVKEVINEIVTSFRIKMPDNVALIAPQDSPECQIYSDRMRLTQVISNFLNNAIKYTSEGCITLAYEIIGDEIKFSVTDTGDGMSQEIQAHIFDRFYKGNTFKQGTGLGLSICETIVNRLGGRIGVNSELGKGSTFWFTHPYSFSPNAKSPASPNPGTI